MASQYVVDNADMKAVADAIREKGETSDELVFPDDFVEAVNNISAGTSVEEPYIKEYWEKIEAEGQSFNILTGVEFHGYSGDMLEMGEKSFSGADLYFLKTITGIENVTIIPKSFCYELPSVEISELPEGLIRIGETCFYGCPKVTIKTIPKGVQYIEGAAFFGCTGLTSVTFKGTPKSISDTTFGECDNLTEIKVPWAEGAVKNAPWGATNAKITYNYTE